MTKYREILRLDALGFSKRNIALSCSVSRNTVARVLKAAAEKSVSWPLDDSQTDKALETILFPKDKSKEGTDRPLPDYEYIRKDCNTVYRRRNNIYGPDRIVRFHR